MNILEKIIAYKKPVLAKKKQQIPLDKLKESTFFGREIISVSERFKQPTATGIIAEFKRRSPSKSAINLNADVLEVATAYERAGATALSVLTDEHFFGGNIDDIKQIRNHINIPILRKDFIFDEYQIYEAKSIGADFILLIAEVLSKQRVMDLAKTAHDLNLEVLLEIHSEEQLPKINKYIDLLGINNRNLKTFEVSIQNSINLINKVPGHLIKVSESGIKKPDNISLLRANGFQGFLIGESFMKTVNPGEALQSFIAYSLKN